MNPLRLAERLIDAGIPVLVVPEGRSGRAPRRWQQAKAVRTSLAGFRPGVDALIMVCGRGIDIVDEDTKIPGNTIDNLPPFKYYGVTRTPSGGAHYVVPSAGLRTRHPAGVGDYQAGDADGRGRGFVYLPGSVRADKYPDGRTYVEEVPWDIAGVLEAVADPDLVLALDTGETSTELYIDNSPERVEPGIHPYAEAAIARELSRLRECEEEGWGGPGWDITTFQVACNLIEFANSRWTGYTLEAAEIDVLEYAPVDEGFGPRAHAEKWASGLQTVGQGGRRNPDRMDTEDEHPIWDATPLLSQVRDAAHSRLVGSGCLLAYVLGRVLAEVPARVLLPPVVGKAASLNIGFAIVGESGTGKSAAAGVAAELLGLDQDKLEIGLGSGEGLIESYLEPDPDSKVGGKRLVKPASRILMIDEISQLGSVAGRTGSSIMSIMTSGLTGGKLNSANATAERRRNVPAGAYRMVVMGGVQPARSDVLLDQEDAGTPQRFCWVSATDATIPDEPPEWPGVLDWESGLLELRGGGFIDYPVHVKEQIRGNRLRVARGDEGVDRRHGHQMLTQLKIAAALTLLHGEDDITDQWWTIAAHMMRWSEKEQQRCRVALAEAVAERARSKAKAVVVEREVLDQDSLEKCRKAILRAVDRGTTHCSKIRKTLTPINREVMEDALEQLVASRAIELIELPSRNGGESVLAVKRCLAS